MRRIAPCFVGFMIATMIVTMTGCQNLKPKAEPMEMGEADYDSLQPDLYAANSGTVARTPVAVDSYSSPYGSGGVSESPQPMSLSATTTPSGRMHLVGKGDTLYRLSRQYYGTASRWRDIYSANSDVLSDPNQLRVGQELIIP
jgi:nucleoid-associated protein YgaU